MYWRRKRNLERTSRHTQSTSLLLRILFTYIRCSTVHPFFFIFVSRLELAQILFEHSLIAHLCFRVAHYQMHTTAPAPRSHFLFHHIFIVQYAHHTRVPRHPVRRRQFIAARSITVTATPSTHSTFGLIRVTRAGPRRRQSLAVFSNAVVRLPNRPLHHVPSPNHGRGKVDESHKGLTRGGQGKPPRRMNGMFDAFMTLLKRAEAVPKPMVG